MAEEDQLRQKLMGEVTGELTELRQAADRLDEAVATLCGLNRTDLRCLGVLYQRGRVTAGELAEAAGLTPGAMTTALDRLEKGGFANRVADPEDRRRVLVISTAAAREVGARIYGEVEVAGRRLLEALGTGELTAIGNYLSGTREIYERQVAQITTPLAPTLGAPAAGEQAGVVAVSGAGASARLQFIKGAARVVLGGDPSLAELYRADFEGPAPDVSIHDNTITIQQKNRFHPGWRMQSSHIALNTGPIWTISFRGGMWTMNADLRDLRLESMEVVGGASEVDIWLPAPERAVPVRISGGANRVTLHRPQGVALRVEVVGGASQLIFDEQRLGSVAGRLHLASPGFDEAEGRYQVRFTGGASQIAINTV
jgi:DNA-binding MarR family transcriptional regulator